jgi:hypothetical protein
MKNWLETHEELSEERIAEGWIGAEAHTYVECYESTNGPCKLESRRRCRTGLNGCHGSGARIR